MNQITSRAIALVSLCVLSIVAIATVIDNKQGAHAQNPGATPAAANQVQQDLRELTTELVAANNQYHLAGNEDRGALLQRLKQLVVARHELLAAMIQSDPAEVLQVALPDGIRASLPAKLQSHVEQHVDLEGELEVLYRENDTESQLLYFLNSGNEHLSLHFAMRPDEDLLTGTRVRVKGVRVGEAVAMDGGTSTTSTTSSLQVTAPAYPNTFGEQKVLILLVNFLDKQTQPYTLQQARDLVFGNVNNYYREASYQQTWLTGDAYGWFTLPINSGDCQGDQIATYAKQAATSAGVNLSAYNRYIYVFPSMSCSGYTGWSYVGGNPSEAWINGSLILRTVAHELGHSFGLYHSLAKECGSEVVTGTCSDIEYGDILDMMGKSGITGHFNAYQKQRLGWLNYGVSPPITTVEGSGTYWVDPYESAGLNPKALRIWKSTDAYGRNTWYYVEFRRPLGFDSFISSNTNVMNGVMIHTGTDVNGYNYLLDMTPETTSWSDAALDVGRSYNDPNTNVTIAPISVDNTGAAVTVTFGPQQCVQANPSMSLLPSASQWVTAGSTVTYEVLLTNNNSAGCSSSNFSLQASVPVGWSAAFNSPTLTISPGGSANATLTVTSSSSSADGFYNIDVTGANIAATNYAASGSVTCAIMSDLGVSVVSDQTTYTRGQSATITANVSAAGSPVSGASVTFTMTKPNGATVTGTATTGSNGSAIFKYRFNKQKDPVGTYQVAASGTVNGVVGTGMTSFSVR